MDHSLLELLCRAGISDRRIASHYGVSPRTVLRWRQAEGLVSTWTPVKSDHGESACYNAGCRCALCRAANSRRMAEHRLKCIEVTRANNGVAPIEAHGLSTATNWGCRCQVCVDAVAARNVRLANRIKRGEVQHVRGGSTANCPCGKCAVVVANRLRQANSRSLERATRHHQEWTGPELEIVSRNDLSHKEMSLMTGRTLFAVRQARQKIRSADPRYSMLLGAES